MNELSYQSYILSRSLWLWGGDDNEKDRANEDPEIGLRKLLQIFRVDGSLDLDEGWTGREQSSCLEGKTNRTVSQQWEKDISLKCSTLKN